MQMLHTKEFRFNKYLPHILIAMLSIIAVVQNIQLSHDGDWRFLLFNFFFVYVFLMAIWLINAYFMNAKFYIIIGVNFIIVLLNTIFVKLIYNPNLLPTFPIRIVIVTLLFVAIQQSLRLRKQKETLMLENVQLKSEAYKAELENLKSQMNPHFLFNSLTTLQALIRKDKEVAEEFVVKLSELYRIYTQNSLIDKVSLENEVELMQSYFYLMKIRFEEGFEYSVEVNNKSMVRFIPSFTLQQIIENCFKHNLVSVEKPLRISVYQKDENSVSIRNNIQSKISTKQSSKKGLENLSKRYDLMGIENGVLIDQDDLFFEVTLKLM